MSRRSGWLAGPWLAVVSPVVLILGWEVASATGLLREALFPRPSTVLAHLRRLIADGTLLGHALPTLSRIAWAFALAAALGIAFGLAMGLWRRLREGLDPVFAVVYPIVRDLAADGGRGWTEDRNLDLMTKYASSKKDLVRKARPHVADPNLELDASTLDSMQKLNADLGYLKYTEFLSADKLFTFTYRDRAVKELGRR